MAIEGRSLGAAARDFVDHLNGVLSRTVTQARLVAVPTSGPDESELFTLGFRQGGRVIAAPLETRFGALELYVGQRVASTRTDDGRHRLRTEEYRYTVGERHADEPTLRWEYRRERGDPDAMWCRHHVQGTVPICLGSGELTLNDLHVPSGFTTIEEIIRFCIVDLGVQPLSDSWNEVLDDSYDRFKTDFTA